MSNNPIIDDLVKQVIDMEAVVEKEKMLKMQIEFSDDYIALNKQEDAIRMQKLEMLEHLKDSSGILVGLKTTLMAVMEREGKEVVGPYKGKFKEKKEVNTKKVLEILNDDISHFLRVAKITQVDLKSMAREEGGERGEALENCIEVTERKLVDLEPLTPDR